MEPFFGEAAPIAIGLAYVFLLLLSVALLIVLVHLAIYLKDPHGIRDIPGPPLARLSDVWLAYWASQGVRSRVVHAAHQKYGPIVRIAPNHVSFAVPEALQIIYGHGTGTLKADFYDAFVSIRPSLFTTRNRQEHTQKRKIISHIFSQKSVLAFEVHIRDALVKFVSQWDRLCEAGVKGERGDLGEGGFIGREGRVWFDGLPWFNYLAFDIIGDLAFGSPFGMLLAGRDSAPMAVEGEKALNKLNGARPSPHDAHDGNGTQNTPAVATISVPAVSILNGRGDFSATLGALPPWIRPWVKKIPWFARGNKAVENLAGLAFAAVAKRLTTPTDRVDLLARLQEWRDDNGKPMDGGALAAEALTQLIAGSDTTSNSSCAITYYLARYPRVQEKLRAELREALTDDDPVTTFEQVKRLSYLQATVNEGLRLHSTSGIGLPRSIPEDGLEVCGRFYPEGSVLSVPSYSIHRDASVWGDDVEEFRPERWFEEDRQAMIQKTFNPFSFGPRACLGKNLANMELLLVISTIVRRYDIVLADPDGKLHVREGSLRKPLFCDVGVKRTNAY